jgi:hypothetical protein
VFFQTELVFEREDCSLSLPDRPLSVTTAVPAAGRLAGQDLPGLLAFAEQFGVR